MIFQLEWIYPFIFEAFPPLLLELLLVSFLLPFSIATMISLILAYLSTDWITMGILGVIILTIIVGVFSSAKSIIQCWKTYHWIQSSVIEKQKSIIHELILTRADNLTILRNEANLTKLEAKQRFPIPGIVRVSTLLPLLGSFFGYFIGIALLT